jgi:hypothetical protein
MKFFIKIFTILGYMISTQSFAMAGTKDLVSSFESLQNESFSRFTSGSEFMSGQEPGTVMMKVNLWGAVRRPGIHHIPVKTDLVGLMSFAGGPNDNALIDEITIKRQQGNKQTRINVDLSQLIHGEYNNNLTLQPDDIIVVPANEPWISQNTFTLAIFASTIASIILSAVIIDSQSK